MAQLREKLALQHHTALAAFALLSCFIALIGDWLDAPIIVYAAVILVVVSTIINLIVLHWRVSRIGD